uniref:Uncharacterized protein n=1 Tax=Mycena chlorophos TaxID=658473 RepID=A0ABQ0L0T2_MYCCL|nr:predicted protein [Mycena chlorophos]
MRAPPVEKAVENKWLELIARDEVSLQYPKVRDYFPSKIWDSRHSPFFDLVKQRIHDQVEEQHAADLERFRKRQTALEVDQPEDVAEARRRIPQVVQPLIDMIAKYTNTRVSLFYGNVENETEVVVQSIHSKESEGVGDFAQLAPQAYNDSVASFSRYIAEAYCQEKGLTKLASPAAETNPPVAAATDEGPAQPPPTVLPTTESTPSPSESENEDDDAAADAAFADPDGVFARFRNPPGPLLRAKLLAMSMEEREKQIRLIWFNSAYENQREENIIHNAQLLASLNIPGTGVTKRNKKAKKGGARKKVKVDGTSKAQGDDDDSDDSDDPNEDKEPLPARVTRSQTTPGAALSAAEQSNGQSSSSGRAGTATAKAKKPGNASKAPVTSDGGWARRAKNNWLRLPFDYSSWGALVEKWWNWEKTCGFVVSTESHDAAKRPTEVGWWVSRGRRRTPNVANTSEFAAEWLAWWRSIRPVEGDEDWSKLDVPGQNGMLNVLACLVWWAAAEEAEEAGKRSKEWKEAVDDVDSALERMTAWKAAGLASSSETGSQVEGRDKNGEGTKGKARERE